MRALAGAALTCTLLGPLPATARVIEFTCTVVMEGSGSRSQTHGGASPYASNVEQFVNVSAGRIAWGSRVRDTGAGAGMFSIDTLTGRYM